MGAYLNKAEVMQQLEWIVRILLAGACGGMIGYERESRKKSAGLRTHVIVAVSSALMTVLSKYGFQDVVGEFVRVDPARIAAGTVAAIGFLGSGIIFSRDKNVSGNLGDPGRGDGHGRRAVYRGHYHNGCCCNGRDLPWKAGQSFAGHQGRV